MKEPTTRKRQNLVHPTGGHIDRHAHYAHDLPESTAESVSRGIIRTVPLVYGLLLGGLIDSLVMGLLAGGLLSGLLDLSMGRHSLLRGLMARLCPLLALLAHGLESFAARGGSDRLRKLRDVRCRVAASPNA